MSEVIQRVMAVERLQNTASGNPKWRLTMASGYVAETEPDSAVNYFISESIVGTEVVVRQTRNGKIAVMDAVVSLKDVAHGQS